MDGRESSVAEDLRTDSLGPRRQTDETAPQRIRVDWDFVTLRETVTIDSVEQIETACSVGRKRIGRKFSVKRAGDYRQ